MHNVFYKIYASISIESNPHEYYHLNKLIQSVISDSLEGSFEIRNSVSKLTNQIIHILSCQLQLIYHFPVCLSL